MARQFVSLAGVASTDVVPYPFVHLVPEEASVYGFESFVFSKVSSKLGIVLAFCYFQLELFVIWNVCSSGPNIDLSILVGSFFAFVFE